VWLCSGCQGRSALELTPYPNLSLPNGAGNGAGNGADTVLPSDDSASSLARTNPRVCVFDYDLTLSSHLCSATEVEPGYSCRQNSCDTYGWYSQCLGVAARKAIAECVRRRAYIGIASKANVDYCWKDKVIPIVTEQQFPELTVPDFASADSASSDLDNAAIQYPRIDDRANWNCEDCAYTMDGALSKPDGIRRVLRHYGLRPELATDRARVIFWDDTSSNIDAVRREMPEVKAILVGSFTGAGVDGGCGLTEADIEAGWTD
jgi:hypothetical protein